MHYQENTKHVRLDGWVCFYRQLFFDAVKPQGCISWPVWPLRGIYKTAWGAKLILMADLAFPVSCASMGHPPMAQQCPLCLNVCFSPPTAPYLPPPSTPPPPTQPPPIDSILILQQLKKLPQKLGEFKLLVELAMKY